MSLKAIIVGTILTCSQPSDSVPVPSSIYFAQTPELSLLDQTLKYNLSYLENKKKKPRTGYPFEDFKLLADKAIKLYENIYDKATFERGNFKIGPKDDRMIMRLKLQQRPDNQKKNYKQLF